MFIHINSTLDKTLEPEDLERLESVNILLMNISVYRDRFKAALDLADTAFAAREQINERLEAIQYLKVSDPSGYVPASRKIREEADRWLPIAFRDAIMTLYHLDDIRAAMAGEIEKSAFLCTVVNLRNLKDAWKAFRQTFPDIRNMRDAIAHAGLFMSTPNQRLQHSRGGPNMTENISNRTFCTLKNGKISNFELSDHALSIIDATIDALESLFVSPHKANIAPYKITGALWEIALPHLHLPPQKTSVY